MKKYFINNREQDNGDHEVHEESCRFLPLIISKTPLGYHSSCHSAVREARKLFGQVNGCKTCSEVCHTQ